MLFSQQVPAQTPPVPVVQREIALGVLAFRPKLITEAQWKPLIEYLNQTIPAMRVSLRVMSFSEMEAAVTRREVDVVLTNPAHYVLLGFRNGLSSPIVTLVNQEGESPLRSFGGVIVVRADRDDMRQLADLKGKRISTPDIKSFGGYLTVAYEMQQAGIPLPQGDKLIETGMPHDRAVDMVQAGTADAAFVRTSVYEGMKREGKFSEGQLRIVNQKTIADFPFALSTRLYPEWLVATLPHIDEHTANEIAAALLKLPHDGKVAKQIGIHGFNVPMDYRPVTELLKALRQPPFDVAPAFTLGDIWKKYNGTIVIGSAFSALILLLLILLWRNNRILSELRVRAETGDVRLRQFSEQLPGVLYQYCLHQDGTSHYPYASQGAHRIFGVSPEAMEEDANNLFAKLHPDDSAQFMARVRQSAETMQAWKGEYRVVFPDGSAHWREASAWPQLQADGSILWHGYAVDIDERKAIESRSGLLAAALEASANAVAITDLTGQIEWVNQAFVVLTGYERDELVGVNPRVLKSGMHDAVFYSDMWGTLKAGESWRGEIINRKKDGSLSEEELIIAPVKDDKGKPHHYIGIKQDISERKRMEQELRTQATTDTLTGLPNRRYFFSRAEGELARIKRGKTGMASIIMFDIDHFKRINDTYGHGIGDEVLKHLSETVLRALRLSDFSARIGGEEFVVLLPETNAEQGFQFAERLRTTFVGSSVETEAGDIFYTASFGLTIMGNEDLTVDVALARADEAQYRAKKGGRNRVEVA